ncbi:MAG: Na/Pi cotransporter family protein [Eubacteriales bacterium]
MTIFDLLTMIGGLCLFLYGMSQMGEALERRAGSRLRSLLGKLTSNKAAGFLTGLGVTAVIQSSSVTTVMVVGFVNSGLMTLRQAINVIMGANVGTTITAWILSLSGIESGNMFVQLLKPSSFTPVLALIGILLYMSAGNKTQRKDTGMILLGFAVLMFGMETMSDAVSGLKDVEWFRNLFLLFQNPILGVVAGTLLTAIIQSSSASVGILQALSSTGQVSYGAAIPIIMGQNIGTCVTALLSSVGANRNAKRAAFVHLSFNIIGTAVWLTVYGISDLLFHPALFHLSADAFGIAVAHSIFNVLCTILLLPMSGLLEKLAVHLIPEPVKKEKEPTTELDERLLATPAVALERCSVVAGDMANTSAASLRDALDFLTKDFPSLAESARQNEEKVDHYEDILGTYLVRLSGLLTGKDSNEAAKLLHIIGDFERISDHAVNLLESAEEMRNKKIVWSDAASAELNTLTSALREILSLTLDAFLNDNMEAAERVEPLEQVIDKLKETLRARHIERLQRGDCTIEAGFIWSDLLTALERTSDHCSNIAGCVIDIARGNMNLHESLRAVKSGNADFERTYAEYAHKYELV